MREQRSIERLWSTDASELVAFILGDAQLCSSATWHPLGFVHLEMAREEGRVLRFHLWPKDERRPKMPLWPIHNHVFALTSRILFGSITNRVYQVAEYEGVGKAHQLFGVSYSDGGSALCAISGLVTVRLVGEQSYDSGSNYRVPLGVFHESVVPTGELAATLVEAQLGDSEAPVVVGEVDSFGEYFYQRALVETSAFAGFLNELLSTSSSAR